MQQEMLNELAQAGYEARCAQMMLGIYQDSMTSIPSSNQFFHWEDLEGKRFESAVKTLYRKQAEATIGAFFAYLLTNGTPEAKQAVHTLIREIEDDQERAQQ